MKRFLLSRPLLTTVLLFCFIILPSTGLFLPLIFEILKIELDAWLMVTFMLGGPLLSFLLVLPFLCVPTLKCVEETLDELWQIKRRRKAFHAPKHYATIESATLHIEQNLEKRKLKKIDCETFHPTSINCEGIWEKDINYYYKYFTEPHPTYYFLYTTNHLDFSSWESLKEKINRQILNLRTESLRRGSWGTAAYAICILCNSVESTISKQVTKIQSFKIANAHVCIGVIPENNWYLPADRIQENESSKLARTLLGKGTFGLKHTTFPYKGNTEYTSEFYHRLEHLCNTRIKDNVTDEQRKKAQNGIRDLFQTLKKNLSAGPTPDLENTQDSDTDSDR